MIVAIDGPAASGKGTIARAIARHFGFPHLDTGLLYRAIAMRVQKAGASVDDVATAVKAARDITLDDLNDDSLRDRHIGEVASIVAANSEVRAALVDMQRNFVQKKKGAVLDGRDIGTFICPDAPIKIFVTAKPETRAERRTRELKGRGEKALYNDVLKDIRNRDRRDSDRAASPLKQADDAIVLDTTDLKIDESITAAIAIVNDYLQRAG